MALMHQCQKYNLALCFHLQKFQQSNFAQDFLMHKFHHFVDTQAAVFKLSKCGLTRGQSAAIARTAQSLLIAKTQRMRNSLVAAAELDKAQFFRDKQAHELRSELEILRRNETALLRTELESISRALDALTQKSSEKIASLKSDVTFDLNNHKTERRALSTRIDLRIQEIHHKLTVELSTLKTRLESVKMEATQRAIWVALVTFGAVLISHEIQ
ncbi:hypothetical protein HK100_002632 [Physocladia obscura]|uniref:Uncharacterized protein n=1 Tax=Physocladia obscura TaxID=109957 RepID=A0AAD5XFA4_9FUNG|nr:hypothetical protein HK100_002632 [Physocladia obscura]